MTGCCALGCNNRPERGFKLFQFPRNPERRIIWAKQVSRRGWRPTQWSRLCQIHFEDDQFENRRVDGKRKLIWNAIPTLFSHTDTPKHRKPIKPSPSVLSAEELKKKTDHTYSFVESGDKNPVDLEDVIREEDWCIEGTEQETDQSIESPAAVSISSDNPTSPPDTNACGSRVQSPDIPSHPPSGTTTSRASSKGLDTSTGTQSRPLHTDTPDATTLGLYTHLFDILTSLHTAVATLSTNMQSFDKRLSILEANIDASGSVRCHTSCCATSNETNQESDGDAESEENTYTTVDESEMDSADET